jgi:hypothetical protein
MVTRSTSKHLPVGWQWLRFHDAHRTGLVVKGASETISGVLLGVTLVVLMEGRLGPMGQRRFAKWP